MKIRGRGRPKKYTTDLNEIPPMTPEQKKAWKRLYFSRYRKANAKRIRELNRNSYERKVAYEKEIKKQVLKSVQKTTTHKPK